MTIEFTILAIAAFAAIAVVLVWATKILHAALRAQNILLQQQVILREAELLDQKKRYAALQRDKDGVESELRAAISRGNEFKQCFFRIGINGNDLDSSINPDTFWRDAALQLVRCSIDETAIDRTRDDKTNAIIIATAMQIVKGKPGLVAVAAGASSC